MTETTTTTVKTTPARKPRTPKAIPAKVAPAKVAAPAPAPAPEQAKKTAADYRKEIDLLIITAAGALVTEHVPAELREQVARLIANQLHHLSTPKAGWPSAVLPKPERSDWR
jgi:hypothetical protein